MWNSLHISFARGLMILCLLLLAVLEFLWLKNEYHNKYRDMEAELNHVMFSAMRDVEDSLIFSKLTALPSLQKSGHSSASFQIEINTTDSARFENDCPMEKRVYATQSKRRVRHPMRGILLERFVADSTGQDSGRFNIAAMVMNQVRLTDSTGEHAGYHVISWQGNDTVVKSVMSRPQLDIFAGRKLALVNPNYKAEIFGDLLPHISFALFLWLMVGAAFYYIIRNLQQQMHLNAIRDEFVSNITHELKTPITTVGVALESLAISKEVQGTESRRYLDICRSELMRLSMLVDRILHSRAAQVHMEKMDMSQVLDDVLDRMKVQFESKGARVRLNRDGEQFFIHGDSTHISGVLYNLLDNALKYSPDKPKIDLHLKRENGSIHLAVKDHGIGIPYAYQDKIFEKLYRVPGHNRHDVKGHGLGLGYVKDIINTHGGSIDLRSEPGRGSTFFLTLPAWDEN